MANTLDSIRNWLRNVDQSAREASERYLGPHVTQAIQNANDFAGAFGSAGAAEEAGRKAVESKTRSSAASPCRVH